MSERDVSVQLNLKASYSHLAMALYYIENAYNITDDEILASTLMIIHNEMSVHAKVVDDAQGALNG